MNKYIFKRIDLTLLIPALILCTISLATLYSLDIALFEQQLFALVVGLVAYVFFTNVDYRIFGFFAKYLYIIILAALSVLFLIGFEAKGAVRWIDVFGISIQFSEIFKPFFVIVIAYFLSRDGSRDLIKYVLAGLLIAPVCFLIMRQPDLGSALIYGLTGGFMILLFGFPLLFYIVTLIAIALPMPIVFNLLHGYQRDRITSFINPTSDVSGTSYNAIQALISIGSGGFYGKGFGQATQSVLKFLPERHTDFIFATISENLGFIGGSVIIIVFAFLLYKIYKIGQLVDDKFTYLIVMGFYGIFLIQVFFNIGMNIGILPIVGITLPFVSYGGSSLLTCFIILGILSAIRSDYQERYSMEIK